MKRENRIKREIEGGEKFFFFWSKGGEKFEWRESKSFG